MLTTIDIAKAMNVSPRIVQIWCKSGLLPAYKVGRSYRIETSDFEAFKEKFRTTTIMEGKLNE